jgi:DNA-directed RNA polymerase specialized sigma24 family protein
MASVEAELSQAATRMRLLAIAGHISRTNREVVRQDLVSDALVRICDPDKKPWRPPPPFLDHMAHVMRDVFVAQRRRGAGRFEVVGATVLVGDRPEDGHRVRLDPADKAQDPAPTPDEALSQHQEQARAERLGEQLRARIAHLPDAARVLDLARQGVEGASEVAALAGCSVDTVYQAHRTIRRYARELRDEAMKEAS